MNNRIWIIVLQRTSHSLKVFQSSNKYLFPPKPQYLSRKLNVCLLQSFTFPQKQSHEVRKWHKWFIIYFDNWYVNNAFVCWYSLKLSIKTGTLTLLAIVIRPEKSGNWIVDRLPHTYHKLWPTDWRKMNFGVRIIRMCTWILVGLIVVNTYIYI